MNYAKYMIYSDMHLTKSKKKILGEVHCTCRKYYILILFGNYPKMTTEMRSYMYDIDMAYYIVTSTMIVCVVKEVI